MALDSVKPSSSGLAISMERDGQMFRGPAGATKDACQSYLPESQILVAEAGRYLAGDLIPIVSEHLGRSADITIVTNPDNSPAGIFLLRQRTLDLVPRIGFNDLKEQWLGKAVDASYNVRVHRLSRSRSYGLRTREEFLEAARAAGGITSAIPSRADGVSGQVDCEDDGVSLGDGVLVGRATVIVDSVVMPGAEIGEGAIVARSIVCPGARIPQGATVVDAVVPPAISQGATGLAARVQERSESGVAGARE
jgi:hypothetical protein